MGSQRPYVCALLGPKKCVATSDEGAEPHLIAVTRSGKTSILNTVLDDMEPVATLYNESTREPWTKRFNAFLDFEFWDMPGGRYDIERLTNFSAPALGACIFVIDAQAIQGDNADQARKIAGAIFRIHELNLRTTFEIFIHKIDGMSETYRQDIQLEVSSRIKDELDDLAEAELGSASDYTFPVANYHFTSIYQSNIYEALSKVISRLMPCQGPLERLLDLLYQNANFEKAYLFDLASKLYFATDSTPGDPATHEICTEYIDLHWEMDQIYAGAETGSVASDDEAEPENGQPNGHIAKPGKPVRSSFSGSVALANGTALCHWELSEHIAIIARGNTRTLAESRAVVESNIASFKEAVLQIRDLEQTRD